MRSSMKPLSAAAKHLQEANAVAVEKRAETARNRSIAKSEKERRDDLYDAAIQSLTDLVSLLDEQLICERLFN